LVEVPKYKTSCRGKSLPQPTSVPCSKQILIDISLKKKSSSLDFACSKGKTFDRTTSNCRNCEEGTFSLGGGQQYTFNTLDNIASLPKDISLKAESLVGSYDSECKKKE
jgi:hypothetical protein